MLVPAPAAESQGVLALPEKAAGASPVPALAHLLPSLTDVAFLMPLMFLFCKLDGVSTLLFDGDTGWHIRTGEWILAHRQVPHVDLFSFSRPGAPWFAWEWLSDVIFAVLHRHWGLAGVVLAGLALICLTSVGLFRLVRRKSDNGFVAIAVTLLATGACSIHWLARPHLFTLLLVVAALHITERAAEGRTRLLAWLPPMTLVWTNLHGGFFVVFLLLACYIGSDLLNAAIEADPERRRGFLRSTKPWLAAFAACFAVTFINPYGWELHRHMTQYLSDPYQLEHIAEFQALSFHAGGVVYFEPLMLAAVVTALWDAKHRRFADVFMSLGWLHLALIAQRNLPIFAIAASPVAARGIAAAIEAARGPQLTGWVRRTAAWFGKVSAGFEETDRLWRVHFASVMPLALVGVLMLAPRPAGAKFRSVQDPKHFPAKALAVVRRPDVSHIFTTDQWGDYLIYNLFPSKKVFIDGRSDFYGDRFGLNYLDVMGVKYGWEKTFAKYDIDTVMLSPSAPLAGTLKISRDWRPVYDDGVAIVFRRTVDRSRAQVSPVSSNGRNDRDRAITISTNRDRKITQLST